MSANNKTDKIRKTSELGFSLLTILIIFLALALSSCQKQEPNRYSIIVQEEKDTADIPEESIEVNITETNQTSIISIIPNQSEEPEVTQNETQIPERANAVEFYFLLKGKSYFRHILKETELKAFDLSGTIVRIEPIFIANDSVVFKIDNYPTNAIREREWYSAPNFEIYVSNIYYRR
jgi:hypothetical protein